MERIPERSRKVDLKIEKAALPFCIQIGDNFNFCYVLYELLITNVGENDATDVQVIDELISLGNSQPPLFLVIDDPVEILPEGNFEVLDQSLISASIGVSIPEIPAGDFARVRFWAITIGNLKYSPQFLINSATVSSNEADQIIVNNSVTIETLLN